MGADMVQNGKKSFSQTLTSVKEVLVVLREAILPVIFISLLLFPSLVNNVLQNAGFTEGSFAGLTWQKSVEQTKVASKYVADVGTELEEIKKELEQLEVSNSNPSVQRNVESLLTRIEDSQKKTKVADQTLKSSLINQEEVIERKTSQSKEQIGWIYLGKVDENKIRWERGYPKSIVPVKVESVREGEVLKINDDVYLRGEVSSGPRSAASVLSVVRVNEQVQVLNLDFSHAKGGGWFVWTKVRRI